MKQSGGCLSPRPGAVHGPPQSQARRGARPAASTRRPAPDYRTWSVEELRALARQLQLPDAATKNRRELLGIFDVSAA